MTSRPRWSTIFTKSCWGMVVFAKILLFLPWRAEAQLCPYLGVIVPSENSIRVAATVVEGPIKDRFARLFPLESQQGPLRQAFGYDHFVEGRLGSAHLVRIRPLNPVDATWLGTDSLAVVARWQGEDHGLCGQLGSRHDTLSVGSRYLFVGRLRAESLWVNAKPTFDVIPGLFTELWANSPKTAAGWEGVLARLPPRSTWEADCRPHLARIEEWVSRNSEIQGTAPLQGFRDACQQSLESHASGLEREKTKPVPPPLHEVYRLEGCSTDPYVVAIEEAVDGRFLDSDTEQWVFPCPRDRDWRILIATLETVPRLTELLRLVGSNWTRSTLLAAPPQYFDWMDSPEFVHSRNPTPRPHRDIVLLRLHDFPEEARVALFQSPRGWENVGLRCCRALR